MDFSSGPWTGFYNYGSMRKHRMDLVLIFVDRTVSGDGNNDIADSLLSAVSIRQTASVTGLRPTSARTTFSIAGSEKAKGFGDYGSC